MPLIFIVLQVYLFNQKLKIMKKIIVISMLSIIFMDGFCQLPSAHLDWIKYLNEHQFAGLVLNPGRLGIGAFYISKRTKAGSFITEISHGTFIDFNGDDLKSWEIGIGYSFPVTSFSIDLIPIFNTINERHYDLVSPLTLEIGAHTLIREHLSLMMTLNPFLWTAEKFYKTDIKIFIGISF